MKNYRTTVMGALTLLTALSSVALALFNNQSINWETTIAAITAGIGLIAAHDATNPIPPKP